MKSVVLVLALAVIITGCNARYASLQPWQETVGRFWQYVAEINTKATDLVENIKASELSREMDTLIADTMAELTVYRDDVQTKLGPYAQETGDQLTRDLQLLVNKLQNDMVDAKEHSTQYLGELKTMMEQNVDDVQNRINTYNHKLKKRLDKDTEEIRNTVATYLGEIADRTSHNLDMVKGHVEPYLNQAHDTAVERLGSFSSLLKTQADGLSENLRPRALGLKTQLESTTEELRTALQGKISELGDMLHPYAVQISDQIRTIVAKVKEAADILRN